MSKSAVADPLGKAIKDHDTAQRGVEIVLVVDETGSMQARKPTTISAINEYLDSQRQSPLPAWVTMAFFNSEKKVQILHSGVDLKKVPNLVDKDYLPTGNTPLYDAIGQVVRDVEKRREQVKKDERPGVLFVVVTDGEENASTEFKKVDVSALIAEKEKDGWTFVYIGAQRDAWQDGMNLGVAAGNTTGYMAANAADDLRAFSGTFKTLSASTAGYRTAVSYAAPGMSVGVAKNFWDDAANLGNPDDQTNTVRIKSDTTTNEPPKP